MQKSLYKIVSEAIRWSDINEEVNEAINVKADIMEKGVDGTTFLHKIARFYIHEEYYEDLDNVIRYALENGCSFKDQAINGCTPIHYIAINSDPFFLDLAIKHSKNDVAEALVMQDVNGETPYHWFCIHGRIDHWKIAIKTGTNPFVKDNKGELPREKVMQGGALTAAGKKQFLNVIAKTTKDMFNPDAIKELIAPAVWKQEKAQTGEKPAIRGIQTIPVGGTNGCSGFHLVDDNSAIILTEEYYMGMNLENGSILWRQRRFHLDDVKNNVCLDGIWYGNVGDSGVLKTYVIAIDPQKGFDADTEIAEWITLTGGWYGKGRLIVYEGTLFMNTSSAFIALDRKSGKIRWKIKPAGQDGGVSPFVWNGCVYIQSGKGKKYTALAFDIQTGEPVENRNVSLPCPIYEYYDFYHSRVILYEDQLLYFTEDDSLALVNPRTGELIRKTILPFSGNMFVRKHTLDVHIYGKAFKVDLNDFKITPDPDYGVIERSSTILSHITEDLAYVAANENKGNPAVEIYSRKTGSLIHRIDLPKHKTERSKFALEISPNGKIYTSHFYIENKQAYQETAVIY